MLTKEDSKRVEYFCKDAIEYLTAILNNLDNLHWSYLMEKTEDAQIDINCLRGFYKEYRDKN